MEEINIFLQDKAKVILSNFNDQEKIKEHFIHYLEECFESFISLFVYSLLTNNNNFELIRSLKISLIIGLVTFCLELYKPKIKQNIISGIFSGIGNNILKSTSNIGIINFKN